MKIQLDLYRVAGVAALFSAISIVAGGMGMHYILELPYLEQEFILNLLLASLVGFSVVYAVVVVIGWKIMLFNGMVNTITRVASKTAKDKVATEDKPTTDEKKGE